MSREPDTILFPTAKAEVRKTPTPPSLRWARFKAHARLWQKWWLRPHKPYQPLFVIATWRSGSNLLLSYLNQQPGVSALSEVLLSTIPMGPSRDCLPPEKAIGHIRLCLQGEKTPIRGCKIMLHQLANCGLVMDDLNAGFPNAKYVILYRQSLAEQFLSHKIAEATSQYVLARGQTRRDAKVVVNSHELRTYCDDVKQRYHEALECRWLAGKSVLLSYEELVDEPQYWLQEQICPLLDVPFATLEMRLQKQNTRPLAEQIVNYREVAALIHSPVCTQRHGGIGRQFGRRAA